MKKTVICAAAVLSGIAFLGFYNSKLPSAEEAPLPVLETASNQPKVKQDDISLHFAVPAKPAASKAKQAAESSAPAEKWTHAEIEEDFVKAYQKYPHLRETAKYASKALLSDSEMATWRKFLEDETLIKDTLKGVVDHYQPDYDLVGSIVNQERIKYLRYAAQLANNPASRELFSGIEAFVTDTQLDMADFSDELKRDVAGDKIELIYIYEAFQAGGKERLDELAAQSPKFAKLLKYARENSQHLNRII